MPIAHIYNGELGFDVRTKLNALIDQVASIPVGPGGTGDVTGPAGAIADSVAVYNGVTGKLIKDGGATIANIIASAVSASGTGDVVGPASAVADRIAVFNGTTGKLIKDGGQSLASLTFTSSQITDFAESTDDRVAGLLVAGSNITLTYNDPANTLTIASTGGGGGGMAIGGSITSATAGSVLFAGPAGVLAQDNANFWFNNTTDVLTVGGHYNIGSSIAIFTIPNVSGNNWFEGAAGNVGVTGYANFGTGDGALGLITSGSNNVGIGTYALANTTTGSSNVAMGYSALGFNQTGTDNFAMGPYALGDLGYIGASPGGNGNVGVGTQAFIHMQTGSNNVGIGSACMTNVTTGVCNINTILGSQAAYGLGSGAGAVERNTFIGAFCGKNLIGAADYNTWVGSYQGAAVSPSHTIVISEGQYTILDYNYMGAFVWSLSHPASATPIALHVYNSSGSAPAPVNYERAIFDWTVASNVLTIGTQRGGTGVLRPVNIIGSALTFNGSPIGGGGMAIGGSITSATAGSVLFAGAAGVLAQDNANFWFNDTTNDLKIGGSYYIGTFKGLYRVPNALGDNWFEGDAGNLSVTGNQNFGTGAGALLSLTTGEHNVAVGYQAMLYTTTGSSNFAFGTSSLQGCIVGGNNIAIGYTALQNATGDLNVGIGPGTLQLLDLGGSGGNNVGLGKSFNVLRSGYYNTACGYGVGNALSSGTGNTFVGCSGGANMTSGDNNTFVGCNGVGYFITSGSNNTLIGGWYGAAASISNIIAISIGGNPSAPVANFGYSNAGWTFVGSPKAGAPAAGDLPVSSFAVIDDTSGGATWLVFNKAGTIRKVQLV